MFREGGPKKIRKWGEKFLGDGKKFLGGEGMRGGKK